MADLHANGVVLAAGRSTRMGRDKALLSSPDGGGAMWERQRDVLRAAGVREIYLSARPEQTWARAAGARMTKDQGPMTKDAGVGLGRGGFAGVLYDALPGGGPMVGITAALERAVEATHVAVLAIDLPRMNAEWFALLCEMCAPGVGAVGRGRGGAEGEGFFEPLAAIYPREAMWLAWEALARGEYSLQRWVTTAAEKGLVRVRQIGAGEAGWFENWNSPGEAEKIPKPSA